MTLTAGIERDGPKKLLAIDGGGIRSVPFGPPGGGKGHLTAAILGRPAVASGLVSADQCRHLHRGPSAIPI
jgi:hypothetical protein